MDSNQVKWQKIPHRASLGLSDHFEPIFSGLLSTEVLSLNTPSSLYYDQINSKQINKFVLIYDTYL